MSNYLKESWNRNTEWSSSDVKTIKNGKQANIGGESMNKRAILNTSTKLEKDQLLRSLDSSKDPDYDVFGNNDLK